MSTEIVNADTILHVRTLAANGQSSMAIATELNMPLDDFKQHFQSEIDFVKESIEFVKNTAACGGTTDFMSRQLGIDPFEFEQIFQTIVDDAIEQASVDCAGVVLDAAKNGCVKSAAFIMQRLQWNPKEFRTTGEKHKRNARVIVGNPTGRRQAVIRRELIETTITEE